MKICSASLTIKEIQIKITQIFHLTAKRMIIIKKGNNSKWQRGYGENEPC